MNTLTNKKKLQPKVRTDHRFHVFSRHPSHSILRSELPRMPFKCVVRLGSTTIAEEAVSRGGKMVEINEIRGVQNSSSKLLMKKCFTQVGVKTAPWYTYKNSEFHVSDSDQLAKIEDLKFPVIVKSLYGSRGEGNSLVKTPEDLNRFIAGHDMNNYIIEHYMSYSREYRLHIDAINNTCFYTCRKMLKNGTPENEKFQRHDDNCVWILENNEAFDKPSNWNSIVEECVKAIKSVGLDIGGIDLRVQSELNNKGKKRENVDFIVIESCSAPSFGNVTAQKYIDQLPIIARQKARQLAIYKEKTIV